MTRLRDKPSALGGGTQSGERAVGCCGDCSLRRARLSTAESEESANPDDAWHRGIPLLLTRRNIQKINIAIIPPATVSRIAVALSKQLAPFGTHFVLDQQTYFAHVTLLLGYIPANALPSIIASVRTVCQQTRRFVLYMDRYRQLFGAYPGYVDVSFQRNPAILQLRQHIVRHVRFLLTAPELTAKPYVPHITLTKLRTPAQTALTGLPRKDFSFTAKHVGLFAAGKHGTCQTLLGKFPLLG